MSDPNIFWQTNREWLPGNGTDEVGEFERSLPQQNEKNPLTGEHIFYDPRNYRSGWVGGSAERGGDQNEGE